MIPSIMHIYLIANSCLILCYPMDCNLPGSCAHGISQARILEWVAIPSSKGFSRNRDGTHVSCISCTGRQVLHYMRHWESTFNSHTSALLASISFSKLWLNDYLIWILKLLIQVGRFGLQLWICLFLWIPGIPKIVADFSVCLALFL